MIKKYYLAYGSNLNIAQMRSRCPTAIPVGSATLDGYRLIFRGSKSGSYLTIEPCAGSSVPVGVWEVTSHDEIDLDTYEGYPRFYGKETINIDVPGLGVIDAFIYIMPLGPRNYGLPSIHYLNICAEGYLAFKFDVEILHAAVQATKKEMNVLS